MKTINNDIKEHRVSFDNAKFLKEAGFSCGVKHTYTNIDYTRDVINTNSFGRALVND